MGQLADHFHSPDRAIGCFSVRMELFFMHYQAIRPTCSPPRGKIYSRG
jgi:hypothetical protein